MLARGGLQRREFVGTAAQVADKLRALAALGCAGAVLGMSLYTGRLDAAALAQEFAS